MRPKYFPPYFFVTLVAVTLAAALVWLDSFRSYEADAVALVLERTARGGDTATTLAGLSQTLPFYDRVLLSNEMLDDEAIGLTPDARKAVWQKKVQVVPMGGGVLAVRARGVNQEEARLLARATVTALFETASLYYNVKSDIDVRLVESGVIRPVITLKWQLVLYSLVSGIVVTGLFFGILTVLDRLFADGTPTRSNGADRTSADAYISPDTFKPVPPAYFPVQEERTEYIAPEVPESELRVTSETAYQPRVKASAPSNLPVLEDDELPPLLGAQARLIKADIDATVAAQAAEPSLSQVSNTEEPSAEEYKRRLNALLAGE